MAPTWGKEGPSSGGFNKRVEPLGCEAPASRLSRSPGGSSTRPEAKKPGELQFRGKVRGTYSASYFCLLRAIVAASLLLLFKLINS